MKRFLAPLFFLAVLFAPYGSFAQSVFSTTHDAAGTANSASIASTANFSFAERVSVRGISGMGKVSSQLFRGAQPDLASLDELKTLGITTIVDLRAESAREREKERVRAEALGMHFVSIPIGGFSTPSSAQLAQFFALLRQSPSEKIFVHCRFGHDRTGVFIAAYRMAFEHWTPNQALSEMNAFGFNHTFHHGMGMFVRDFPNLLQSDPVLKSYLQ